MTKFRVLDVYRKQPWYQARPEPEEEFEGTLESMQTVIGPANRPSLAFILRTEGDDLLVYAAGVMDILEPLVVQPLRIRGKTVDFPSEGGTRELWGVIGSEGSSTALPHAVRVVGDHRVVDGQLVGQCPERAAGHRLADDED
jgi:hypothetical protein